MKNVAVICNNFVEWKHFVDTLQFSLTKENKPYKAVAEYIVDIEKQVKYFHVNASIVDNDIHEYLMNYMIGE